MQGEIEGMTSDSNQISKTPNERRKRINRIKTAIIIIVMVLMIMPTIICIFLGIQVNKLQKQVNDLASLYNRTELSNEDTGKNINYAHAAVIPKSDTVDIQELTDSTIATASIDTAILKAENLGNIIIESQLHLEEGVLQEAEADTDIIDNMLPGQIPNSSDNDNLYILNSHFKTMLDLLELDPNTRMNDSNTINKEEVTTQENEINISSTGIYSGKKVYLTFDDGPSFYTEGILNILAEYQVKATFFVVGKEDKYSKKLYQRIVDEGHTLGMHSYSHEYKKIYKSIEDFDKDFTKLWKLLYDTTGYKPSIFRFPGGSANRVNENGMDEFIRYLNENKIIYYDWNALNGDATGEKYTNEQLIDNVLKGVALKRTSIILMHDSEKKAATRDTLPEILETLIEGGAQILPLDKDVTPIQQIKFDTIK